MLGWRFTIGDESLLDTTCNDRDGLIASWEVSVMHGTDWLDQLTAAGKITTVELNGGYPDLYSVCSKDLMPYVKNTETFPPRNHSFPRNKDYEPYEGYLLLGEDNIYAFCMTVFYFHYQALIDYPPDKPLFIQMFDLS